MPTPDPKRLLNMLSEPCPTCGAQVGEPCIGVSELTYRHTLRVLAVLKRRLPDDPKVGARD